MRNIGALQNVTLISSGESFPKAFKNFDAPSLSDK
jgi:hypothetical protein